MIYYYVLTSQRYIILSAQSIIFSVVCEGGSLIRTFCGSVLCSHLRYSTVDTWETWKDFFPETCETSLCVCSCRRAPLYVKDRSLVTVVFFFYLYVTQAVLTGNACLFTAVSCFRFSHVWKLPGATAAFHCFDSRKNVCSLSAPISRRCKYICGYYGHMLLPCKCCGVHLKMNCDLQTHRLWNVKWLQEAQLFHFLSSTVRCKNLQCAFTFMW